VTGCVNHHCARAIDEVSGRELIGPALQAIFKRAVGFTGRDFPVNRKNGPDTGVDIDVGGAVQWIEHQDVPSAFAAIRNRNNSLGFFGRHHAKVAAMSHCTVDRLLRELIEFLHGLAVHIEVAGFAKDPDKTGLVNFP
jgi:hypothetical protein